MRRPLHTLKIWGAGVNSRGATGPSFSFFVCPSRYVARHRKPRQCVYVLNLGGTGIGPPDNFSYRSNFRSSVSFSLSFSFRSRSRSSSCCTTSGDIFYCSGSRQLNHSSYYYYYSMELYGSHAFSCRVDLGVNQRHCDVIVTSCRTCRPDDVIALRGAVQANTSSAACAMSTFTINILRKPVRLIPYSR